MLPAPVFFCSLAISASSFICLPTCKSVLVSKNNRLFYSSLMASNKTISKQKIINSIALLQVRGTKLSFLSAFVYLQNLLTHYHQNFCSSKKSILQETARIHFLFIELLKKKNMWKTDFPPPLNVMSVEL